MPTWPSDRRRTTTNGAANPITSKSRVISAVVHRWPLSAARPAAGWPDSIMSRRAWLAGSAVISAPPPGQGWQGVLGLVPLQHELSQGCHGL